MGGVDPREAMGGGRPAGGERAPPSGSPGPSGRTLPAGGRAPDRGVWQERAPPCRPPLVGARAPPPVHPPGRPPSRRRRQLSAGTAPVACRNAAFGALARAVAACGNAVIDPSGRSNEDLANLGRIRQLDAPIVSIGGAGTFDGIFVTGHSRGGTCRRATSAGSLLRPEVTDPGEAGVGGSRPGSVPTRLTRGGPATGSRRREPVSCGGSRRCRRGRVRTHRHDPSAPQYRAVRHGRS